MDKKQETSSDKSHGSHLGADPQTGATVTIDVNGTETHIHRGSYVVSELKEQIGVEAAKELDIVVNGEFQPLSDDERIVIKGGEVFVSHARRGGSS